MLEEFVTDHVSIMIKVGVIWDELSVPDESEKCDNQIDV